LLDLLKSYHDRVASVGATREATADSPSSQSQVPPNRVHPSTGVVILLVDPVTVTGIYSFRKDKRGPWKREVVKCHFASELAPAGPANIIESFDAVVEPRRNIFARFDDQFGDYLRL
jgi:hypothetical protein